MILMTHHHVVGSSPYGVIYLLISQNVMNYIYILKLNEYFNLKDISLINRWCQYFAMTKKSPNLLIFKYIFQSFDEVSFMF